MPALAAAPSLAGILWGSGIAAGGAVAGSLIGSRAQSKAGQRQEDAARYAADVQAKSAAEERAYLERQAAEDARRYEIDRRANYDIANAHEQRLGTLSQMFGFGQRQGMPAYVPGLPADAAANGGGQNDPRVAEVFNRITPGLAPTSQNLEVVIKALNDAGVKASRATHAGNLPSDDFIKFDTGGGFDFIQNVGSPNAKWQMLPPRASGAGGTAGSLREMALAQEMLPPTSRPGFTPTGSYIAPSTLRDYARRR